MKLDGAGAPGTIGATVNVGFADGGDGTTRVTWDADAVVGGMIGGVGQRMLTSVSKRMAGEFFGNVDKALSGTLAAAPVASSPDAAPVAGQVFTAPPSSGVSSQADFVKGIAVGAGLVLLGVVAGAAVRAAAVSRDAIPGSPGIPVASKARISPWKRSDCLGSQPMNDLTTSSTARGRCWRR